MSRLVLRHLPQLDSLRFFAASSVVLHHLYFKDDFFLKWFADFGNVGVDVFFVLSGFIITTGIVSSIDKGQFHLGAFLIRRGFRLWPSLFLAMTASTLMTLYFARTEPAIFEQLKEKWWHYSLHFGNYSYAYFGKLHHLFAHYWSLAVEEHFYLLWPLLLVLCGTKIKKRYFCLTVMILLPYITRVLAIQSHANEFVLAFTTHNRLDALAIGCLLALIYPKIDGINRNIDFMITGATILFFYLGLHVVPWVHDAPMIQALNYTFISLGSCGLILSSLNKNSLFIYKIMNVKAFSYLGLLSYGVYLFHIHTHTILFGLITKLAPTMPHWPITIVSFVLPYIPAYLVYIYIDQYFMRWREQIIHRYF